MTVNAGNRVDDAPLSRFHKKLALYSSGGPFLDGYVLSIIGVAMVQITPQLGLSDSAQGLLGASALIGVFLGAFAGGYLTDKFGRQVLYTIDLVAIVVCSVVQFWASDPVWLFVLRLLIGMAVGADYPIATSLLAEFTPRRYRGPLLGGLVVMWFVGAAVAYVVGEALLQSGDDGWRWMLASAALPATVIVLLRLGTPESPRWLANKGRTDEAEKVLRTVYGPDATIADLADEEERENVDLKAILRSGYGGRMLYISVFWTCSIVPLFAVYAFGPKILGALNLQGSLANIGSALITVMFLIGCVIALFFVNRMGRRPLVIHSFVWSGLALLLLGLFPGAPRGRDHGALRRLRRHHRRHPDPAVGLPERALPDRGARLRRGARLVGQPHRRRRRHLSRPHGPDRLGHRRHHDRRRRHQRRRRRRLRPVGARDPRHVPARGRRADAEGPARRPPRRRLTGDPGPRLRAGARPHRTNSPHPFAGGNP